MSQSFTASDGAVITYTPPPAPTPTPTPTPGALVPTSGVAVGALTFNDDFTGTSLDATKWSDTLAWGMNNTTLNPGNVSVANSVVTLTLSSPTVGAGIHTAGKWAQGWGYYEWRVWGPSTDWWAAWMTGVGAGSPAPGFTEYAEIDIAELLSGRVSATYHVWPPTGPNQIYGSSSVAPSGTWTGGWHTFGANYRASGIDWYYDQTHVRNLAKYSGDVGAPIYPFLNIGNGAGDALATGAQVHADWFRAWA